MTDPLTVAAILLLLALAVAPFVILRRRKRRQQPTRPVLTIDRIEANYAHAHGYTPAQWQALTPNQRRDLRNHVAYAPYRKDAA